MKKTIILSLLAIMMMLPSFAQEQSQKVDPEVLREKIITKKKAIYTERLELTKKESEKFWPIYEKYDAEMFQLRDKQKRLIHGMRHSDLLKETPEKAEEQVNDLLTLEEQIAEVTKRYFEQFKTILPAPKVAKLLIEERSIMRELTKCKKHKGKHGAK